MASFHTFALFSAEPLQEQHQGSDLILNDKALVYRISRILRLKVGEHIILFDGKRQQTLIVVALEPQRVVCKIVDDALTTCLKPEIHWLVPLLEKDAMERVVYDLSACGITSWTPIVAEKSHRNYVTPKELERLKRIAVAACEQAKQFCLPVMNTVSTFSEIPSIISRVYADKGLDAFSGLFFDPDGRSSYDVMTTLREKRVGTVFCMMGPEGDLTPAEKKILMQLNFEFCALVPTILRAEDACSLACGMLRSFLK